MASSPTSKKIRPAHEVVASLRQDILDGRLVPNQRLVESDLAEELHTSRGHVRTALAELTVEGLVERVQNRGARVRALSVDEAVEITEIRGALESFCARKAASKVTDEEIAELQHIGEIMSDAVARGDRDTYSEANKKLHRLVISISDQPMAAQTIQRLRGQAVKFQYQLAARPGRPATSLPQHLEIIEALCSRNEAGAAEAMRLHLESVASEIRATQ